MRTTLKRAKNRGVDEIGVDLTLGSKSDWITIKKTKADYKAGKRLVNGQSNCFHDFLMISIFTPVYKWHMDYNPDKYFIHYTVGYSCPYKGYHNFDADAMKSWLIKHYTQDELKDGARLFLKYKDHAITFANYKDCPIFKISPKPNTYIKRYDDSRGMRISYENNAQKLNPAFVEWFVSLSDDYEMNKQREDSVLLQELVSRVHDNMLKTIKKDELDYANNMLRTAEDIDKYFKRVIKHLILNDSPRVKQSLDFHTKQLVTTSRPVPLPLCSDKVLFISTATNSKDKIRQQFYTEIKKDILQLIIRDEFKTIRSYVLKEIEHGILPGNTFLSTLTEVSVDGLFDRYYKCIKHQRQATSNLITYLYSEELFPVSFILEE